MIYFENMLLYIEEHEARDWFYGRTALYNTSTHFIWVCNFERFNYFLSVKQMKCLVIPRGHQMSGYVIQDLLQELFENDKNKLCRVFIDF